VDEALAQDRNTHEVVGRHPGEVMTNHALGSAEEREPKQASGANTSPDQDKQDPGVSRPKVGAGVHHASRADHSLIVVTQIPSC